MRLTDRIRKIQSSATMRIKEQALRLKSEGKDVVDLTAGEPDFPTPDHVRAAAVQAISDGYTRYTAVSGLLEVREQAAEKFRRENHLSYRPDEIIVSTGAKQCLINALLTLAEPGDEVLIATPYWVSYPEQVKLAGALPKIIPTDSATFKLTPEQLAAAINEKTRVLILNSPSNPSGVVYSETEIRELMEVTRRHKIWILSDEIYEKIIYDGRPHFSPAQIPEMFERTIVVNGVSKAYAMTGWRIGFAAGPRAVIQAMTRLQGHMTSNATAVSQRAALAALRGSQDFVENMRKTFQERRDLIARLLSDVPEIRFLRPAGAFYFFLNISKFIGKSFNGGKIEDAAGFCERFIENSQVVTVPGDAFGCPGYIRISFAASTERLTEGMKRLKNFTDCLKESNS